MNKNNCDFEKRANILGKWGIVGFVLSLPIMIWKSSRIGRVLFVVIIVTFFVGVSGRVADLYFLKWRYRVAVGKSLDPIKNKIEELKERTNNTHDKLNRLDQLIEKKMEDKVCFLENRLSAKQAEIVEVLDEVENGLDIIHETERQSLKLKIIELKEKVKKTQCDINNKEIRVACEDLSDDLFLLTPEEKDRFYSDLKEIGFEVEKEEKDMVSYYAVGYGASIMSRDVCAYWRKDDL